MRAERLPATVLTQDDPSRAATVQIDQRLLTAAQTSLDGLEQGL